MRDMEVTGLHRVIAHGIRKDPVYNWDGLVLLVDRLCLGVRAGEVLRCSTTIDKSALPRAGKLSRRGQSEHQQTEKSLETAQRSLVGRPWAQLQFWSISF